MIKFINNTKFRIKLFAFAASVLTLIIFLSIIILLNGYKDAKKDLQLIEETILDNFDSNIKSQVEHIISLLHSINEKYKSGDFTLEEAKVFAADLIRNIRYDDDGYFWVDTTQGINVVLFGSATEGTNRYDFQDYKGTYIFREILDITEKDNSGYLNYWFPKSNQSEPLMKRAYIERFEPFDWIVGTGNYLTDIEKSIAEKRESINKAFLYRLITMSLLFFFIIIITTLLVFLFSKSITYPLLKTTHLAHLIAGGLIDASFDGTIGMRKDEIGQLANSIEKMKLSIKNLIDNLTEKAKMLQHEKELFSTTLKSIGDGVVSTDENGIIVLVNTAAEDLTGYIEKDIVGKAFEDVFMIVNEHTRKQCDNPVTKALTQNTVVSVEPDIVLIKKDGSERFIEDSASPIIDGKGNIVGTVLVIRDVTEKKEKQRKIEYLSYHDQLTGLFNRHYFDKELKRLDIVENLPFTIALADVNGLKLTNDAFGHEAGNLLLQNVAKVFMEQCSKEHIVSRIGGDEFVLLLPKTSSEEATILINKIYDAISLQKNNNIIVSVSIGLETKTNSKENINDIMTQAENNMYSAKIIESQSMRNQTIKSIMETLYASHLVEKVHSQQVAVLSRRIGEELRLDDKSLKELETAGLLHDIGKITINAAILNKPSKLTQKEYMEIKKHPEASYHILKSADVYTSLAEYVLSHHERWDGNGYPRGLAGENIPFIGRIISVADSYEAMTSIRAYKQAFSHEEAMSELKRCSGTQFDATVVEAFEKTFMK